MSDLQRAQIVWESSVMPLMIRDITGERVVIYCIHIAILKVHDHEYSAY